jgi:hypothetical protein
MNARAYVDVFAFCTQAGHININPVNLGRGEIIIQTCQEPDCEGTVKFIGHYNEDLENMSGYEA